MSGSKYNFLIGSTNPLKPNEYTQTGHYSANSAVHFVHAPLALDSVAMFTKFTEIRLIRLIRSGKSAENFRGIELTQTKKDMRKL